MKIPAARKLPSGSWFVRVTVNGVVYNITKPTKKEAEAEAAAIKSGAKKAQQGTVHVTLAEAIDMYIERNKTSLSPSTLRAYRSYQRSRFQALMGRDVSSITGRLWQKAVDDEAAEVSPKTIKNVWLLIVPAVEAVTGEAPKAALPKVVQHPHPYLNKDQIRVFTKAVHGDRVEIPALMMLCSLRSSEVADVQWKDVDLIKGIIHVNGSAVYGEDGLVHKADNKTASSNRKVPMMPQLVEALRIAAESPHAQEDYIVTMPGSSIFKRINRICKDAGLPEVGRHGLRHSFASLAWSIGLDESYSMQVGGWSALNTMRKIYTHFDEDEITRRSGLLMDFYADD